MAISDQRMLELPAATNGQRPLGVFRRPTATTGWRSWFTTIDHKKIGILYGATALVFFALGGLEGLIIRAQLATPDNTLVDADTYNRIFTMHGTTMIFLVVMPLMAAFANYFLPLMIGARDVAFPRLNGFSYWVFLAGGLFLYSSFLLGGAPDGAWTGYPPNAGLTFSPGHGIDFWILGLQITGIASLVSSINLIVTVLNMRAPGMSLMRMPVFVWMQLVTQFLLLFAIPVITVALFLLMFDRFFDANFFNVEMGADPLLWQHLFWIFGHPEVYILILPAMGIVSEILPVFSRKPLFGYPFIVFSGIAIGFMGWGVWAHHMFVSGIGPVAVAAFALSTMFIAVPTGVKVLNWLATMWKGKIELRVPMLFAIAFVAQFVIGGLSGVTHSISPHNTQQHDTYYIVAHFHYVLFGGAMFGVFGGFYYWWPKVFGRHLNEGWGKLHFWTMVIGFNLTFGPMHILGLQGMPRRIYTYAEGMGWDFWNLAATVGAFLLGASFLVFVWNIVASRNNPPAGADPWDARTIEWSVPSPPPPYNFAVEPTVTHLDDFWHQKYTENEFGHLVRRDTGEEVHSLDEHGAPVADEAHPSADGVDEHDIHLPSPSYWPLVTAVALPLIAYGLIYTYWLVGLGALLVLVALYGWATEPPVDPEADHADHGPEPHEPAAEHDPAREPVAVGVEEDEE